MKSFMKVLSIVMLCIIVVGVVGYGAITIYANYTFSHATPNNGTPAPPPISKAAYVVDVQELYREIYTNKWSQSGTVYIIYGYWDLQNNKWVYSNRTMKLNSATLGQILINRR